MVCADRPIRWLVDDCAKFVAREKRRGNTYDGIIMDPPSYGRGPGGEIWKLEDCVYELISQCEEVLSDTPLFFAVNSYTTGLSPAVMEYMLKTTLVPRFGGKTSCDEIGLPVSATGGVVPCGATAIWEVMKPSPSMLMHCHLSQRERQLRLLGRENRIRDAALLDALAPPLGELASEASLRGLVI